MTSLWDVTKREELPTLAGELGFEKLFAVTKQFVISPATTFTWVCVAGWPKADEPRAFYAIEEGRQPENEVYRLAMQKFMRNVA